MRRYDSETLAKDFAMLRFLSLLLFAAAAFPIQPAPDGGDHAPKRAPATVPIPLAVDRWGPVRAGVDLSATDAGGLRVAYERERMRPAGAATRFPAGTLAGPSALHFAVEGGSGARVVPSLRVASGVVHSWPALRLGDETTVVRLDAADLALDRMQSGDATGAFDPAQVVELRLVDISGFTGGRPGPVRWTVTRLAFEPSPAQPSADEDPSAGGDGEALLFRALVDGEGTASDAIAPLLVDALQRPRDARPRLLLGLAHTWIAAESQDADPELLEHLMLADRHFTRCVELDPEESRLPSWQVPVRLALARHFDPNASHAELVAPLERAFEADPGFHGFALGLVGYDKGVDTPAFERGLEAVRAALAADPSDPSVRNRPRWPHNVEGFLLFAADYERRAGNLGAASALLERIESVPAFSSWPFQGEVEARRARWFDGETDASGPWMPGRSCVVCHRR